VRSEKRKKEQSENNLHDSIYDRLQPRSQSLFSLPPSAGERRETLGAKESRETGTTPRGPETKLKRPDDQATIRR